MNGLVFTCSIITQLPNISTLLRLKRSAWFRKLPIPTPCLPCRMKSKRRWETLTPNNRWSSLARHGLSFYVINLSPAVYKSQILGPMLVRTLVLIMLVNLRNFTFKAPKEIDIVPGGSGTIGVGFSSQSQTSVFMPHDFPCLKFIDGQWWGWLPVPTSRPVRTRRAFNAWMSVWTWIWTCHAQIKK